MLKRISFTALALTKIPALTLKPCVSWSRLSGIQVFKENIQSSLLTGVRPLSLTSSLLRDKAKRENVNRDALDEGTQGESSLSIDHLKKLEGLFPDENTPDMLFGGVRFADLHIIHVTVTKNNTKMTVTDTKGSVLMYRSCSTEGFKNARKKTTIAAQATGMSLGMMMCQAGIKTVRAKVGGIGPGRIAGLKGLMLAGVNVVSISDVTEINYTNIPRPKKRRRV